MMILDFEKLKQYEPIYVIGHKNPDLDTAISSFLLASILSNKGILVYPCVLQEGYKFDSYNRGMLSDCLNYQPKVLSQEEAAKASFILVDHNDPLQSINSNGKVLFCIDHHRDSQQLDDGIKLLSNYCCNALFIYDIFKEIYQFSENEKYLIYMASLADSLFFKGDRYKEKDKNLIATLGINLNAEEMFHKYFKLTKLKEPVEERFASKGKMLRFGNVVFLSCVIKTDNSNQKYFDRFVTFIENYPKDFLGIWNNFDTFSTVALFKYKGVIKRFDYPFIAGRANTVSGDVIEYLKNYSS